MQQQRAELQLTLVQVFSCARKFWFAANELQETSHNRMDGLTTASDYTLTDHTATNRQVNQTPKLQFAGYNYDAQTVAVLTQKYSDSPHCITN